MMVKNGEVLKKLAQAAFIAGVVGLTACASTGDLDALSAKVDAASRRAASAEQYQSMATFELSDSLQRTQIRSVLAQVSLETLVWLRFESHWSPRMQKPRHGERGPDQHRNSWQVLSDPRPGEPGAWQLPAFQESRNPPGFAILSTSEA